MCPSLSPPDDASVSRTVSYHHVDVFASRSYTGNSLAVFDDARALSGAQMNRITKELRHFESIFLAPGDSDRAFHARVYDLIEELPFAGHPVLGAGCVLHHLFGGDSVEAWTIHLKARSITLRTERRTAFLYSAMLNQGPAEFLGAPPVARRGEIATWFSLDEADLDPSLPLEVVSTGLKYLIVPLHGDALARARIAPRDLERRLAALGAQFAYLLDTEAIEGRHWNNDGVIEDVATGSGAGCVAAFLRRHGRAGDGETMTLRQGRFLERPSEITIRAHGTGTSLHAIEVGGDVSMVGTGRLTRLPD